MFTFDRSLTNSNMHGLFKLQKSALQKKKKKTQRKQTEAEQDRHICGIYRELIHSPRGEGFLT